MNHVNIKPLNINYPKFLQRHAPNNQQIQEQMPFDNQRSFMYKRSQVQTSPLQRDNNPMLENIKEKNNVDLVTLGGVNSLQEIKNAQNESLLYKN